MFKPMLAETVKDVNGIRFPVYASVKLDGIRCLIRDGQAVTRALKPIGNKAIRQSLSEYRLNGLDGEILTYHTNGQVKTLNQINGDVSREDGNPIWKFHAFDMHDRPQHAFRLRHEDYLTVVTVASHSQVAAVPQHLYTNLGDLLEFEEDSVLNGHEGIMIRTPESPYKHGRSTLREAWLLKVKRFADDEATLIDMEELMHNDNEGFENELGHTSRSTAKDGLRAGGVMGALVLKWGDIEFKLGTGFSAADRSDLWRRRGDLIGQRVTFKYKGIGTNGRPLIASFKAFRPEGI